MDLKDIPNLPILPLAMRRIGQATADKFGVRCEANPETGEPAAYYYPLYEGNKLAGYQRKVARKPGERQAGDVSRVGETKNTLPFGSHTVKPGGMLIVTEGGEDAMAVAELLAMRGKNYKVVATLGTGQWKRNLEYFESFEKVVIAYDQDAPGKEAAVLFAEALSAGKGVIATWDGSDPNALLGKKSGPDILMDAINRAKPHTPDGIVYGAEVWARMQQYVEPAFVPLPSDWVELQRKMGGIREAEITMLTGGSGAGKTAYTRRLKSHLLLNTDWSIGEVELEERGEKTWRGVMESVLGQAWKTASPDERREAWEKTYGTNRIFTLDHRSQYGRGQSLVGKFKHLHYSMGCKALFLDHVTLAVSEFGDGQGNVAQDQMMNAFLEFVESTGCHLFLISHLRKAPGGGTSFEEGAIPQMDDLKGSGSLKQVSFNIIGVSRNLQHESGYERNVSQLHLLKCFAPDTQVMGERGCPRAISSLSVGDKVIRPDGTEATVLSVRTGRDEMFRVDQSRGDSYTVSSRHDIVLEDGLAEASAFVGGKGIHARLPVRGWGVLEQPWLFGLWLGDGDKRDPQITVGRGDPEIYDAVRRAWPGWKVRPHKSVWRVYLPGFSRVLRTYGCGWECKDYEVVGAEKRVPEMVFAACAEHRALVLAGWIDADGTNHGGGYSITIKENALAMDCLRLARGLGLKAVLRGNLSSCPGMSEKRWYHRVYISGDLEILPVVCPRKKPAPERLVGKGGRDRYKSKLTVTPVGEGDYVAIEIEGDPLFRLADGTVVHNCRETGDTGRADRLYWDNTTRQLVPAREPDDLPKEDKEPF